MADETTSPSEMRAMRHDMAEIRHAVAEMAKALTRLALLEDRHTSFTQLLTKIADRQESADGKRHEYELAAAKNSDLPGRVVSLETVIRDMHVERQEDKARIATMAWVVRALFAVASSGLGMAIFNFVTKT